MQEMKARPTTYRGIQMRSRLEAKFAAMLDGAWSPAAMRMSWEYEPRCFAGVGGQYLPDFVILNGKRALGSSPEYVEVKPFRDDRLIPEWQRRMEIIWESDTTAHLTIMCGDGWIGSRYSPHEVALVGNDVWDDPDNGDGRVWRWANSGNAWGQA